MVSVGPRSAKGPLKYYGGFFLNLGSASPFLLLQTECGVVFAQPGHIPVWRKLGPGLTASFYSVLFCVSIAKVNMLVGLLVFALVSVVVTISLFGLAKQAGYDFKEKPMGFAEFLLYIFAVVLLTQLICRQCSPVLEGALLGVIIFAANAIIWYLKK